jgi:hypothetical protein
MSAEQHKHFQGLVTATIENSERNGHGHMVGSQGPKGHTMPKNDSHLQQGSYLPQNVWSDGAGCADATDAASADYGTIDKG